MKYSKLKHELEILELGHKHELELLKMTHKQEKDGLINKCNHTYDDGTSAREFSGTQWNEYYACAICGKVL